MLIFSKNTYVSNMKTNCVYAHFFVIFLFDFFMNVTCIHVHIFLGVRVYAQILIIA